MDTMSAHGVTRVLVLALLGCAPQPSGEGLPSAEAISPARVAALSPAEDIVVDLAHAAPADEGQPIVAPPPFSPGIFPCSRCHSSEEAEPPIGPVFPHERHLEVGMACDGCHGEPTSRARPDTCFQCHPLGETRLPAAVASYFAEHLEAASGEIVIPHRWQTTDVDPNHDGHAAVGVACRECHGAPDFDRPQPVALMAKCIACHQRMAVSIECRTCHEEIHESQHANIHLRHAEGIASCFMCHDVEDRDVLRLANGTRVPFDRSYLLCGQCHGERLRDWREGLHGKRVGRWDGAHQYMLCVHCHRDPHDPGFPAMEPYDPPVRPESIR